MPWQNEDDNVTFSGPMADLMGLIMTAYEHDCTDGAEHPTPGEYVTATAVVLREVCIEHFEDEPEAEEFLQAHLRRAARGRGRRRAHRHVRAPGRHGRAHRPSGARLLARARCRFATPSWNWRRRRSRDRCALTGAQRRSCSRDVRWRCALVGRSARQSAHAAVMVDDRKVVVFLAPYLTWNDISAEKTPAIWALLDNGGDRQRRRAHRRVGRPHASPAERSRSRRAGGRRARKADPLDAASLDRARRQTKARCPSRRSGCSAARSRPQRRRHGSADRGADAHVGHAVGASDTDTRTDAGRLRPAELLDRGRGGLRRPELHPTCWLRTRRRPSGCAPTAAALQQPSG